MSFDGIPVYINPLIGSDRIEQRNYPFPHIVVDSMTTLKRLTELTDRANRMGDSLEFLEKLYQLKGPE